MTVSSVTSLAAALASYTWERQFFAHRQPPLRFMLRYLAGCKLDVVKHFHHRWMYNFKHQQCKLNQIEPVTAFHNINSKQFAIAQKHRIKGDEIDCYFASILLPFGTHPSKVVQSVMNKGPQCLHHIIIHPREHFFIHESSFELVMFGELSWWQKTVFFFGVFDDESFADALRKK